MAPLDLDRIEAALARDLATAGPRFAVKRAPDGDGLELSFDGALAMYGARWRLQDADYLAGFVDQVQDTVMEATTEQWPMCPGHRHPLFPEERGEWVAWCCPETDEATAQLGELPA